MKLKDRLGLSQKAVSVAPVAAAPQRPAPNGRQAAVDR